MRGLHNRLTSQTRRDRGSSAVELALVLPVLILLVLGIMETGNMFRTWLTLQKAAQTGTRYASTGQGDLEGNRMLQIRQATESMLATLPGDPEVAVSSWSGMNVVGDPTPASAGGPCDTVQVEVSLDYEPLTGFLDPLLPDPLTLTAHDRKVNEPWQPCQP